MNLENENEHLMCQDYKNIKRGLNSFLICIFMFNKTASIKI